MRFSTYTIIILHLTFRVTTEKWLAVSPYNIQTENDYKKVKRNYPNSLNYTEETVEVRNDICAAVLNSPLFFHGHNVHHVKEDETVLPPIYKEYLNISASEGIEGTKKKLYEVYEIRVGGRVFYEPMFSCKAWNGSSMNFKDYAISREYSNFGGTIRFIFLHDKSKNSLWSVAIAEEPARMLMSEKYHESKTKNCDEKLQELQDSSRGLCDLTPNRRFRLCALVFSTEKYREIVTSLPSFHQLGSTQPKCEKLNSIKLQLLYYKNELDDPKSPWITRQVEYELPHRFDEWAIRCELEQIRFNVPNACIFYISLGLKMNTYFVISRKGNNSRVEDVYSIE